jgi:hypothetical protein
LALSARQGKIRQTNAGVRLEASMHKSVRIVMLGHWSVFRSPISHPSLPGLTRQSIFFVKAFLRRKMDPRVKPAGDVCGYAMPNQMNRKNALDGVNGSQP